MEERHISIGQSVHRIDAVGKVTGQTRMSADRSIDYQGTTPDAVTSAPAGRVLAGTGTRS